MCVLSGGSGGGGGLTTGHDTCDLQRVLGFIDSHRGILLYINSESAMLVGCGYCDERQG